MPKQAAISFHDEVAHGWEDRYKAKGFGARLRVLSSLLPEDLRGQSWLDAGCGTGTLSRWLAGERAASVLAIDGSAGMLAHALPAEGVEYRQGDIVRTGLPDVSFDGIICSSVLEFLPSPQAALQEFYRLLKPGGILLASVPHRVPSVRIPLILMYWLTRPLGRWRWYSYLDHSRHSYSMVEFTEILREQGLAAERTVEYGDLGLPFGITFSRSGSLLMALARKS